MPVPVPPSSQSPDLGNSQQGEKPDECAGGLIGKAPAYGNEMLVLLLEKAKAKIILGSEEEKDEEMIN